MSDKSVPGLALSWCILIAAAAALISPARAQTPAPRHTTADVVVHPRYGGYMLGFGVDPSGREGLFSEYITLKNGKTFIATETFDQKSGKILKVLAKQNNTRDAYSTWGVFGPHVGLDEYYQARRLTYPVLDPLQENAFTGFWTPTIPKGYRLGDVEGNFANSDAAVLMLANGSLPTSVFASNVAANTFGAPVQVTDNEFTDSVSPVMAFDDKTDQAVLSSSYGGTPEIALADLASGSVTEFTGVGSGFVSGIAVDAADGIAVTTTGPNGNNGGPGVQFYDLKKQTGFQVILPCSDNGSNAIFALTVAFDPVHSLFFVEQYDTTCSAGTAIDIYDTKGNLVEMLTQFATLPVSATPIALHPGDRSGFVYQDRTATTLQSFTY